MIKLTLRQVCHVSKLRVRLKRRKTKIIIRYFPITREFLHNDDERCGIFFEPKDPIL